MQSKIELQFLLGKSDLFFVDKQNLCVSETNLTYDSFSINQIKCKNFHYFGDFLPNNDHSCCYDVHICLLQTKSRLCQLKKIINSFFETEVICCISYLIERINTT